MIIALLLASAQLERLAANQANAAVISYSPDSLREYAANVAQEDNIDIDAFLGTLECESQFNYDAVGDHGTSYGVAQIHLPAHLDITKAQALDPYFSINWSAQEWSIGNERIWSCYRMLYGSSFVQANSGGLVSR